MKMIALEAGVSFGLVAHYFGNKESVFIAAGESLVLELLKTLRDRRDEAASGHAQVCAFVAQYLRFTKDHAETFPILLHFSPFSVTTVTVDRTRIAETFRRIIADIEALVRKGLADGSIADLPPVETAFSVYALIVGAVRTTLIARYDIPHLYDQTVDFVARALAATKELSHDSIQT